MKCYMARCAAALPPHASHDSARAGPTTTALRQIHRHDLLALGRLLLLLVGLLLLVSLLLSPFRSLRLLLGLCLDNLLCWMMRHTQKRHQDGEEQDVREIERELLLREREDVLHERGEHAKVLGMRSHTHLVELAKEEQTKTGDKQKEHGEDDAV
eukprot:CAMPEP_0178420698 /NCGR_PEP_ID=MMETSP0689_2-20121128/26266_1 /TAXON_ID=160604 /ORGANISM="Amphidinium massartii, Strain CS-259" /LENGTH=154 /DNA_ID=CAMNT_0020042187 /DNA_START=18 /DNA_END=482 /DNA_ORIENTATION=+